MAFECPSCTSRRALASRVMSPAPRGIMVRKRTCADCGYKCATVETTREGLFEIIREWFGDDQAQEIADEVFDEAIKVRAIVISADRLRRKREYRAKLAKLGVAMQDAG